jgi:hypothetical protein
VWNNQVKSGTQHDSSILSLQVALAQEGLFPPQEFDRRGCPLAGTYGRCTWKSLSLFQQKYNLSDESGKLGVETIQKLNELYGN